LYNNDFEFSLNVRKLAALDFVPTDEVLIAFEDMLKTQFFVDDEQILES